MFFAPFLFLYAILFFFLLAFFFILVEIHVIHYAFMALGLPPEMAFAALLASLIGSYINIPITRIEGGEPAAPEVVSHFGMRYPVPTHLAAGRSTVVAINVGGAIVPLCICAWILAADRVDLARDGTRNIAQRLARRLHDCKREVRLPEHALLAEGFSEADIKRGLVLYEAVGCPDCNDGYKGRVGIYQVMQLTDEIQKIILEGGNAMDIADAAKREGIRDLRDSALLKARNGFCSLAEINRVTKE